MARDQGPSVFSAALYQCLGPGVRCGGEGNRYAIGRLLKGSRKLRHILSVRISHVAICPFRVVSLATGDHLVAVLHPQAATGQVSRTSGCTAFTSETAASLTSESRGHHVALPGMCY